MQSANDVRLRELKQRRAECWLASASKMHNLETRRIAMQSAAMWFRDANMPQHARACQLAIENN